MESRSEFISERRIIQKRSNRFFGFTLEPGDEVFLEQLDETQRELLLSSGSYKDRAERYGVPIGTLRSRLHRARAALARLRERRQTIGLDNAVN